MKEVKVSTRLKDHPVCLSADGPLSIEMEKVLSKQPGSEGVKSDKVLELNANHPVFAVLKAAQEAGRHRQDQQVQHPAVRTGPAHRGPACGRPHRLR